MAIHFVLLVNKQGQTRVAQYYKYKVGALSATYTYAPWTSPVTNHSHGHATTSHRT